MTFHFSYITDYLSIQLSYFCKPLNTQNQKHSFFFKLKINPNFFINKMTYFQLQNNYNNMKNLNQSVTFHHRHQRKYSAQANMTNSINFQLNTDYEVHMSSFSIRFHANIFQLIPNFYMEILGQKTPNESSQKSLYYQNQSASHELQQVVLIIQKANLKLMKGNNNVKHTFDLFDENIGQFHGKTDETKSISNRKQFFIKIQLPETYQLHLNTIDKYVQIVQENSIDTSLTKIIKPVQLIEETIKLRALKLSQSSHKDRIMNKSKTLKINWGDNNSKCEKQIPKRSYLKIDRKKSIQIQGVQFKKSIEKNKENIDKKMHSRNKDKIEGKMMKSRSGSKNRMKNQEDDECSSSGYYTASKSSNPDLFASKNDLSNRKPLMQKNRQLNSRTQLKKRQQDQQKNTKTQQMISKTFGKNISQSKIAQVSRTLLPFKR